MQYSFLLVNYNMRGLILNLLANIAAQLPDRSEFEVVIAENASDPDNRISEDTLPQGVCARIVSLDENRGFVDALNQIIPMARGKFVVVMHPDVELLDGCVTNLSAFLESQPDAGAVSPDLYYPDKTPNQVRLRFPSIGAEGRRILNKFGYVLFRRRILAQDEVFWDRSSNANAETVMSVCMMFRREALQAIGRIDERLVFYFANDYIAGRLRALGWSCHYILAARAIHFERYTPRSLYKSDCAAMEYKCNAIAASPRMRADYFVFLSSFYSLPARLVFRVAAAVDDGLQLLAHLRYWNVKRSDISRLLRSIRVDLGAD